MTTPWKAGDLIQKGNDKRKVLGVAGEVVFIDNPYDDGQWHVKYSTQRDYENSGYTLVTPPEEWPKMNERYYFVNMDSNVIGKSVWAGCTFDANRERYGNVHRTREDALAWIAEVKKIKK